VEAAAALVLGDNLFHGHELAQQLQSLVTPAMMAPRFFAYEFRADPERYGVGRICCLMDVLE